MSSMLSGIQVSQELQQNADVDYAGGRKLYSTGAYLSKLKMCYFTVAPSGAKAFNIVFEDPDGEEGTLQTYFTNKEGSITYVNKKTGKPALMPGWQLLTGLTRVLFNKDPNDAALPTKDVNVKLYNSEAQKEVLTKVSALDFTPNTEVTLVITKERKNKQAKNEATGKWENTAEEQESNSLTKVCDYKGRTSTEIAANEESATWLTTIWLPKNDGKVKDTYKTVTSAVQTKSAAAPDSTDAMFTATTEDI